MPSANSDSLDLGDIYKCGGPASNSFCVIALTQSICDGVCWESLSQGVAGVMRVPGLGASVLRLCFWQMVWLHREETL